jgi:hypothetical protein
MEVGGRRGLDARGWWDAVQAEDVVREVIHHGEVVLGGGNVCLKGVNEGRRGIEKNGRRRRWLR